MNNPLANLEAQGGLITTALKDKTIRAAVLSKFNAADFWGIDRELFPIVQSNTAMLPDGLSNDAKERLIALEMTLRKMPDPDQVAAWIEAVENTRALNAHQQLLLQQLEQIKPSANARTIASNTVSGIAGIMGKIEQRTTYTMESIVENGLSLMDQWIAGNAFAGMVRTGIAELDEKMGGLMPQQVMIVGARPSKGKSVLVAQILRNIALRSKAEKRDQQAVFISLDMSPAMVGIRLASAASAVNWQDVRYKRANEKQELNWRKELTNLTDLSMVVKKLPSPTPAQVMHACEMEASSHKDGISVIVVDFIEQMTAEGTNETAQVSNIMFGLKNIAEKFDCPVIGVSQLANAVEMLSNRMPEKKHLRQSGTIESVAQQICMLYYPYGYAINGQFPTKELKAAHEALEKDGANYLIKIDKNRDEESGIGVKMLFEPQFTRFSSPTTPAARRVYGQD